LHDARKSIYILNNGVPLQAAQTDMQLNRPAEYRAHIDLFHSLFFSLTPDDKFIEYQLKKPCTSSMKAAYSNTTTSKRTAISTPSSPPVPYYPANRQHLRGHGQPSFPLLRQAQDRPAQLDRTPLTHHRRLSERYPRSDNNPHGVLITGWKTLENKDLEDVQKNTF
jgi:hypothetical protein